MSNHDEEFAANFEADQRRQPKRRLTNVECVVKMMEYSPHGAMAQAFVMEALGKWAGIIAKATPEQVGDGPMFNGQAWIDVAKDIQRQLDEHFGR